MKASAEKKEPLSQDKFTILVATDGPELKLGEHGWMVAHFGAFGPKTTELADAAAAPAAAAAADAKKKLGMTKEQAMKKVNEQISRMTGHNYIGQNYIGERADLKDDGP